MRIACQQPTGLKMRPQKCHRCLRIARFHTRIGINGVTVRIACQQPTGLKERFEMFDCLMGLVDFNQRRGIHVMCLGSLPQQIVGMQVVFGFLPYMGKFFQSC